MIVRNILHVLSYPLIEVVIECVRIQHVSDMHHHTDQWTAWLRHWRSSHVRRLIGVDRSDREYPNQLYLVTNSPKLPSLLEVGALLASLCQLMKELHPSYYIPNTLHRNSQENKGLHTTLKHILHAK